MIKSGEGLEIFAGRLTVTGRLPPTMSGLATEYEGVTAEVRTAIRIAIAVIRPALPTG
jgi:capsid portal protein